MTKALIRNDGETVIEGCGLSFIDWKTGAPLTDSKWYGGPYKLVENYVPPADEKDTIQPEQPETEEKIVKDDGYVVIEGKKYNKEELRSLLE